MTSFTYKNDSKNEFKVEFKSCTREPASWKEEVYAAARAIANRAKKPIWVCASGGIDSEVMCRAFFDQGINFSVLTLEHTSGTNRHDSAHAITWCRERGIPHKIVELDTDEFFTKQIEAFAEQYRLIHPFRYLHLKLLETVEELGGFAVLGGGEQIYLVDKRKMPIVPTDVFLEFSTGGVAPLRWCKDNATDHEPYFYLSAPELCLSYMRIPIIDYSLQNPDPIFRHYANTYALKRIAYQSMWPDLKVRYKFHGFEGTLESYRQATKRLRERYAKEYIIYSLPVVEFKRQLEGA